MRLYYFSICKTSWNSWYFLKCLLICIRVNTVSSIATISLHISSHLEKGGYFLIRIVTKIILFQLLAKYYLGRWIIFLPSSPSPPVPPFLHLVVPFEMFWYIKSHKRQINLHWSLPSKVTLESGNAYIKAKQYNHFFLSLN